MPSIFPYVLVIAIPAIASFVLFSRIKLNSILQFRDFFWNYAFAFGILSLLGIPILLINLGVNISQDALIYLYVLTTFSILISYLLFFRGTTFLFTQNRFLTTVLPLIFIPVSAAFSLIALFYLKMSTIIIYTAFLWGFLLVNNNILGVIFLYSFAQGFPLRVMRGKLCALLLSLGWFFILGLDFFLWFVAVLYHPEFWILKISSIGGWYLLRSLAYLIILAGALLCARCRPKAEQ